MCAAGHHGNVGAAELSDHKLARVTHGGRSRPARNSLVWNVNAVRELIRERAEATAEHNANRRPRRDVALDVPNRFARHSIIPAMHADMKFAMVPAATARSPSRARSLLRVGASAPMPPI